MIKERRGGNGGQVPNQLLACHKTAKLFQEAINGSLLKVAILGGWNGLDQDGNFMMHRMDHSES